jgi:hypothetical protein
MSIWNSIVRYIDPLVSRNPRRPRRRREAAGNDVVRASSWLEERPLVCRVCGYRSGPEHRHCLRCLTETMERAP